MTTTMNNAQRRRIQYMTSRLSRMTHHDGALIFKATVQPDGAVLFNATNIFSNDGRGLQWFEQVADLYAIVGPRGGVRKYAGSIDKWEFN